MGTGQTLRTTHATRDDSQQSPDIQNLNRDPPDRQRRAREAVGAVRGAISADSDSWHFFDLEVRLETAPRRAAVRSLRRAQRNLY